MSAGTQLAQACLFRMAIYDRGMSIDGLPQDLFLT
jgi:hypothetical protein